MKMVKILAGYRKPKIQDRDEIPQQEQGKSSRRSKSQVSRTSYSSSTEDSVEEDSLFDYVLEILK